jgi:hypothetical protein
MPLTIRGSLNVPESVQALRRGARWHHVRMRVGLVLGAGGVMGGAWLT